MRRTRVGLRALRLSAFSASFGDVWSVDVYESNMRQLVATDWHLLSLTFRDICYPDIYCSAIILQENFLLWETPRPITRLRTG
jgi:hypothetical protein